MRKINHKNFFTLLILALISFSCSQDVENTEDIKPEIEKDPIIVFLDLNYEGTQVSEVKVDDDGRVNVSDPTREGFTFQGWFLNSDGTGNEVAINTSIFEENITLFAQWRIKELESVNITFDLNFKGSDESKSERFVRESERGSGLVTIEDQEREGYTFAGWYATDDATDDAIDLSTEVFTSSVTVYAHWYINNKEALVSEISKAVVLFGTDVNLNYIDTRLVTDMSFLFDSQENPIMNEFNGEIDQWDVSNVSNMRGMFKNASFFNGSISDWDVSKVTEMQFMFFEASSFNQPIGDWVVSSVENMLSMFEGATSFNQPIGNWNVTSVENMQAMFRRATSFDQAIGGWNVSNVTNMWDMFELASSFNQAIGDWVVSNVTDMESMFEGAILFNQPINNWDVSSVQYMEVMFKDANSFDQNLEDWNVDTGQTNVTNMFENVNLTVVPSWYN